MVYSEATVVLALDSFSEFAICNSSFHSEWAWKYCSTMGGVGLRYSPSDCFENFPFPKIENTEAEKLEQIGKNYHQKRQALMQNYQIGLTELYNLFHQPHFRLLSDYEMGLEDKIFEKKYGKNLLKVRKTQGIYYKDLAAAVIELRVLHSQMDKIVLEAYAWQIRLNALKQNLPQALPKLRLQTSNSCFRLSYWEGKKK
ncbi:MAG: hypothetical protein EAZ97_01485 [Bacteroidetes bacterium]|nr:MAG: hypothetical protein EAZ97_01485 [Bacteroidota bacterium]